MQIRGSVSTLIPRLRLRGSLAIFFFWLFTSWSYELDFLTSNTKWNRDSKRIYGYSSAHISVSFKQCPSLKGFKGKVLYTSNVLISGRNIFSYLLRVPPNLTNAILLSSRLSSKNIKTVNENKKREREKKKKPNCRLYRDQLPPLTESVESLPHYLCLMSFTYYPHCHGGKKGNGGKIA